MSDKNKKSSGFPGAGKGDGEGDLLADFDAWDKNFDSLFVNEESTADSIRRVQIPGAAAPAVPAERAPFAADMFSDAPDVDLDEIGEEFDKELDFLEQPEALGDLLGPLPLPLPMDENDEAARRAGEGAEDEDEDVLTSAQRPGRPGQPDQITRVIDEDDAVVAAALKAAESDSVEALEEQRARAKKLRERMPTIVRRDELERRRRERESMLQAPDTDDDFSGETTRVAPLDQLESLAESAEAEALGDDDFDLPEIRVEVDEEFYDDIEIGDQTATAQDASAGTASSGRRVSSHLLRRDARPAAPGRSEVAAEGVSAEAPAEVVVSGWSVTDPFAGALGSGRAVDPEITLDMRVSDVELLIPSGQESGPAGADQPATAAEPPDPFDPARSATNVGWPPPGMFPSSASPLGRSPALDAGAHEGHPGQPDQPGQPAAQAAPPAEIVELEAGDVSLVDESEIELDVDSILSSEGDESELVLEPEAGEPAASMAAEPASAGGEFEQAVTQRRPASQPPLAADPVADSIGAAVTAVLADVDLAPDLPPARLAAQLPGLDIDLEALPVELDQPIETAAQASQELAEQLAVCERELEVVDDLGRIIQLRLEAGRLSERLGNLDQARAHYEEAVQNDPELTSALRALRRIERVARNWNEAVNYLEAELEQAGEAERHALRAHRVDVLMAAGEQDLARVAAGEILDEDPRDVRALLANLELAFVDARDDEFVQALARLTEVLEAPSLKSCLHALRARVLERPISHGPGDPGAAVQAFDAAAATGSLGALVSMARIAGKSGDLQAAIQAVGRLPDTELGQRDPAYAAALQWRRARWVASLGLSSGTPEILEHWHDALVQAAALSASDAVNAVIQGELAEAELARGDDEAAAQALLRQAEMTASTAEQASALVRAAECLIRLDRAAEAAEALERAAALDPTDPRTAAQLEQALATKGEVDALIELDRQAALADPAGAIFERVRAATRMAGAGRYDDAVAELQVGLDTSDSPALVDTLLDVLEQSGHEQYRVALLQNLADTASEYRDPDLAAAAAARATELYAHQLDAAWRALAAAEPAEAGAESAHEAEISAAAEDRERAILAALDLWQRALESQLGGSDWPEAHAAMIRLASMLGHADVLDDALARTQAATRDRWHAVTLALRRADLLQTPGWGEPDPVRAEELIREAASLAVEDPRPLLGFIQLAAAGQRLLDAAMALEDRAATGASGARADSLRFRAAAILLDLVDEPAQAAELLRTITEVRPEFAPARDMLGQALRRMGEPMTEITADSSDDQRFDRLVRDAEAAHHQAGDVATAIALYQKAMAQRPGDPLVRDGLTRAAEVAGEAVILAELALQELERAQEGSDGTAKADVYEELARIDSEIRGDHASALLSYRAALKADPARTYAARALERAFITDKRWEDLVELRPHQIAATGDPGYKVALHLDRARLSWKLGRSPAAVAPDYRAVRLIDPGCRVALFHLENRALQVPPSVELADLQALIAEYFAGDPRARAAFLTQAGDTLVDTHDLHAAVAQYKEADSAAGGWAPALFGWRTAALAGEQWIEVAEAALREADLSDDDDEKVALCHLAGVALMDRTDEAERAIAALTRVLELEPGHDDAFARSYMLLQAQERYEELAQALERRLEIETHGETKARLHQALADLYHGKLGDPERARQHLRAILELIPNQPGATAALSEIAWELGAWDDAAETLMARARLETDPATLKEIFSRLGAIYAEKKPDPQWAIQAFKRVLSYDAQDRDALEKLAHLGVQTKDWNLALGAAERLLKLDEDSDARVAHLHLMGAIFVDGFGDQARAERAYRTALDLAPTSDAALSALIEFFEKSGDTRSVRVHLDRVIATMRSRLVDNPTEGVAYRVIARALAARDSAGVPGSLAAARSAAELAILLGAGEGREDELVQGIDPLGLAILARRDVDDLLFPPVVSTALRQLFGLLGERIAKHVGMDLRRYGVGRSDRLRERSDPAMAAAHEIAAAMGIEEPVVYVSEKEPWVIAAESTSPISVIIGAGLARTQDRARLRFALGRAIKLALTWFAVPARMSAEEFGVLLVALLRQFDSEFAAMAMDADAVLAQQQRLRRLIPSGLIQELRPFAVGVAGGSFDHEAIWTGIDQAGNRAGFLACGSAAAAVSLLYELGGHGSVDSATRDPVIAELMRFIVSEDHVGLRAMMENPPE